MSPTELKCAARPTVIGAQVRPKVLSISPCPLAASAQMEMEWISFSWHHIHLQTTRRRARERERERDDGPTVRQWRPCLGKKVLLGLFELFLHRNKLLTPRHLTEILAPQPKNMSKMLRNSSLRNALRSLRYLDQSCRGISTSAPSILRSSLTSSNHLLSRPQQPLLFLLRPSPVSFASVRYIRAGRDPSTG